MQRKSQSFSIRQAAVKTSVFAFAMVACAASMAAENGLQRYSAGVGGSDMTSPVVPGWYWQTAAIYYKADKTKGNDGKDSTVPVGGEAVKASLDVSTVALLNRLTYISTERILGANVGFTVMQPMGVRKGEFDLPSLDSSSLTRQRAQSDTGRSTGLGDLEFGPLFHWEIGDNQSANFVPTLVIPTGDYNAVDSNLPAGLAAFVSSHGQRLNMGYGNFYTFRPSAQYAFIGDGWDVGVRGVLSFNTRNKDNGYRSGNMLNIDWQAMTFVSEDVRVGLHGYLVRQFTKDSCQAGYGEAGASCAAPANAASARAAATGNRTSVTAVGPAVAWLKNGGEFLLEGKFLKEFKAKNRTEGDAFWLTLSKPL